MLYDISQPLSTRTAVFPGDTPLSVRRVMTMAAGDSCDVSTIVVSVHAGSHADAPSHFRSGAPSIDAVPLDAYLGPVRVVEVLGGDEITLERLESIELHGVERLLIKTNSALELDRFPSNPAFLSQAAAGALAQAGLRLVGIDTPSMDAPDSKLLLAHQALLDGGVALLENLVLDSVPPGDYELIALPLKLVGLDAAPVRAVLRSLS